MAEVIDGPDDDAIGLQPGAFRAFGHPMQVLVRHAQVQDGLAVLRPQIFAVAPSGRCMQASCQMRGGGEVLSMARMPNGEMALRKSG